MDNLGETGEPRDHSHLMHVNLRLLLRSLEEDQVLTREFSLAEAIGQ